MHNINYKMDTISFNIQSISSEASSASSNDNGLKNNNNIKMQLSNRMISVQLCVKNK